MYQLLTDGICDDVLDVVEGNAGETEIELTQEERGIRERYDSDKKMYTQERIKNMQNIELLDVPKSIVGEKTMKMMHEEVGINRRYACHKEMYI